MGNTRIITLSGIVFYDVQWNGFNREKKNKIQMVKIVKTFYRQQDRGGNSSSIFERARVA